MSDLYQTEGSNGRLPGPRVKYGPYSLGVYAIIMFGVWTYAAGTLGVAILGGGVPVFIYGSIAVGIAQCIFRLSLAEWSSAYPSRAGVIHLSNKLCGPMWGHMAGYFSGGFLTIGTTFTPAALTIVQAQLFASVDVAIDSSWELQKWQIFLIYQGISLLTLGAILSLSKAINFITNAGALLLFVVLFVTIGLIIGFSESTNPSSFVWSEILNGTGFSTPMCILLGLSGPARSIPIALAIQQIGNIATLFAFYVAVGYAVTDWESLLETSFPAPIGALYGQAIRSRGATIALLLVLIIPGTIGNMSYTNTGLRLVHGFAETGALPFQTWLTKWDKREETPIHLLYVTVFVNFVMGCIYWASPAGFTIIISCCYISIQLGFMPMLVGYIATNGRYLDQKRWLRLPRIFSMSAAVFNLGFQMFLAVLYCLPSESPVTVRNLNWAFVFGIGSMALLCITWHIRGEVYVGFAEDVLVEDVVVNRSNPSLDEVPRKDMVIKS